ncbi:type IV pilus modification PilV family protein [Cellvibrio mixtus]|uniref:type IV pilus modification PilV family protein n=1 Tax=Cellvibrio mixtus TaxID=39650 RepID=UPI000586D38C|nr:prepilin-type N-terminal cleavage/methylation domain-containing protein [Cellvibrio mixtus]
MPLQTNFFLSKKKPESGVSLIEMVVFIVVVSVAMAALVGVYRQASQRNVDPLIRTRALEAAQSRLDEILSLKYDEMTPTGGVPACTACNNTTDANMNDVDDYNGKVDTPYPGYNRTVTVTTNTSTQIKLIQVRVTTPSGDAVLLAAERANF